MRVASYQEVILECLINIHLTWSILEGEIDSDNKSIINSLNIMERSLYSKHGFNKTGKVNILSDSISEIEMKKCDS